MPRSDLYLSRYMDKTDSIKRPRESDPEFRHLPDSEFFAHQEAWDRAHAQYEARVNAYAASAARIATSVAEERRVAAEREAKAREAADAKILDPALQAFKRSGGTEAEFEELKPTILAESRKQAALAAATKVAAAEEPRANVHQYL
jgi:hypothetical protein